jgi:hypothetical protein
MPETNESANRTSRPDPLRLPLLVVAGWMAPRVYAWWLAGTGGQHVSSWIDDPPYYLAGPSWWFVPVCLLVLAAGLLFASIRSGAQRAEAAVRYTFGSNRHEHMAGAAYFLSICARVITWGGLLVGVLLFIMPVIMYSRLDPSLSDEESYAVKELFWGVSYEMVVLPLAGVVLGRVVCGALAEGARIRSDNAGPPAFSWWQDLALLLIFVFPAYKLWVYTWRPW